MSFLEFVKGRIPTYLFTVLNDQGITSDEDVAYALEFYKYKSEEQMCKLLSEYTGDIVEPYPLSTFLVEETSYSSEYDVLYFASDSLTTNVISSCFNVENTDRFLVNCVTASTLKHVVTPKVFKEASSQMIKHNYILMFMRMIEEGLSLGATDLHLTCIQENKVPNYIMQYRVAGKLKTSDLFALNKDEHDQLIYTVVEHMSPTRGQDLKTIYGVTTSVSDFFGDASLSLRITANKLFMGYNFVCRLIKMGTVTMKINDLGFSEPVQKDLTSAINKRKGLTLLSGPVNTGKSTVMCAMINQVLHNQLKIVSYETPIEALMPISQYDYYGNIEMLIELIKAAKKQDLDIAMINEIPDTQVAKVVFDLIMSSVHVITTTHMPRLWSLPYKLEEYFGDRYRGVISELNLVTVQKMTKVLCPHCKAEASLELIPARERSLMEHYGFKKHYVSRGCSVCSSVDYRPKLRPVMERIVFSEELCSDLLSFRSPHEMSAYLKEYTIKNNLNLELEMCKYVESGSASADILSLV